MSETQPKGERVKKQLPKKAFIAMVASVVVLGVGVAVGVRWWQQSAQQQAAATDEVIDTKVNESKDLMYGGDYDGSHKVVDEALKNQQLSDEQKADLLFQKGIAYESQEKYTEAISTYKEAEAIKSTQGIAEAIARVAEIKGDKDVAISYYKKAIGLIPADYPLAESAKSRYEKAIKRLGGTL